MVLATLGGYFALAGTFQIWFRLKEKKMSGFGIHTPIFPIEIFGKYFDDVYEPAEDTFLMIDALESQLEEILSRRPLICLEVGCGSGAIITAISNAFQRNNLICFATDINSLAIDCTKECFGVNQTLKQAVIEPVITDLASSFGHRLKNCVDLIVFNPPYVPTQPEEAKQNNLSASWAGGKCGRTVIDRFLTNTVHDLLSDTGLAFLLIMDKNNLNQINHLCNRLGLSCEQILYRRCGIEKLFVLKLWRNK